MNAVFAAIGVIATIVVITWAWVASHRSKGK